MYVMIKALQGRARILTSMSSRLTAAFVLGAFVALAASPATAGTTPHPAPTPLRTITHIYSSPLCTGLRRAITPAVGKVLASDRVIAQSKPLFDQFVRASADSQSKPAQDMAVERLDQLIGPLVANTERVDELLNNGSAFPRVAHSNDDRKLLKMRTELQAINDQQKHALDVISGFVATEQLGELQAAGHEMDAAVAPDVKNQMATPAPVAPQASTPPILNAGVGNSNDPTRAMDPRYKNTDSTLGANPLKTFGNAITSYQQEISQREDVAAKSVLEAVPLCGGHVPAQEAPPSPAPSLTPVPSPRP